MSALPSIAGNASPFGRQLIDEPFLNDPYPIYRALREAGPLVWSEEFFGGAWLLTRHGDVEAMLRDHRFSARRTGGWVMNSGDGARTELKGFQRLFARAMLFLDAPEHQRVRRVLQASFRPEAVRCLRPYVEAQVCGLLDDVDAIGGFDFMEQLARPLPARVIAKLLGVADDSRFIGWSDHIAAFLGAPQPTMEQARRAQASLLELSGYFEAHLDGRDSDGLLDCLVRTASDRANDDAELLAQCVMLLFAGHETTRNLLGNGLYHLLSRPMLWQDLQRQPHILAGAVRELSRFDSPVQYTGRRVATDLEMHGQALRRGELVLGLIGAANRDPRRYEDPDRLDFGRQGTLPLSFGTGPHVCIGAALTLMEAEVVFRELMRRWPALTLSEHLPHWSHNPLYRGLDILRVHEPMQAFGGTSRASLTRHPLGLDSSN